MSAAWKALLLLLVALACPMHLMGPAPPARGNASGNSPCKDLPGTPAWTCCLASFQPAAPHHAATRKTWRFFDLSPKHATHLTAWRDLDGSQVALLFVKARKRLETTAATAAAQAGQRLAWTRWLSAVARALRLDRAALNVFSEDDLIVPHHHAQVVNTCSAKHHGDVWEPAGRSALRLAAGSLDTLADALKRLARHLDRAAEQGCLSASPAGDRAPRGATTVPVVSCR